LAARQHRNVTRAQLLGLGFNDEAIAHRVRTGSLHREHRGVYAVGTPASTGLERAMAAVLACGPTALLSDFAALRLWGFSNAWPEQLDVTVTSGRRRPSGIPVHRHPALTHADRRRHFGVPVTSAARTVLDCAPRLRDRLTRTINDALHTPHLTERALADVAARNLNHPGARLVGAVLDDATSGGLTRSAFEDRFRSFCARFGLPRPQFDVIVAGHLVDALFAAERVIVECDGWEFHRLRTSFESDRDRDADTLAAGFATVRLTWRRLLDTPQREAARLRQILSRASSLRAGSAT
jgi:very-short-patch-repair endonuclease